MRRYRVDRDSRRRLVSRARIKEVVDRRSDKLRIEYHRRDRRSRGLDGGGGGGGGGSLPDRDPFSIVSSHDIRIHIYLYGYQRPITTAEFRQNSNRSRCFFARRLSNRWKRYSRTYILRRTRSRGKTLANNEDKGGGGEEGGKGGEEEERGKKTRRKKG